MPHTFVWCCKRNVQNNSVSPYFGMVFISMVNQQKITRQFFFSRNESKINGLIYTLHRITLWLSICKWKILIIFSPCLSYYYFFFLHLFISITIFIVIFRVIVTIQVAIFFALFILSFSKFTKTCAESIKFCNHYSWKLLLKATQNNRVSNNDNNRP